jgi:hypothetical protein
MVQDRDSLDPTRTKVWLARVAHLHERLAARDTWKILQYVALVLRELVL